VNEAPVMSTWDPSAPQRPTGGASSRAKLAAIQPSQRPMRLVGGLGQAQDIGVQQAIVEGASSDRGPDFGVAPVRTRAGAGQALPPLRVIGQAATLFIVAEGPDGLYLIDQHAAHERVLYERMLAGVAGGTIARQPLLEPVTVTLPPDEADGLEELLPSLGAIGIEVEVFGLSTFLVRALPAQLGSVSVADLLTDVALVREGPNPVQRQLEERLIRQICKRAAVKAGQILSPQEMDRLVKDLEQTANPRTCPHGRPTIVQIATEDLARQFGRPAG
jgi:DNA mismatch repair protein MutL